MSTVDSTHAVVYELEITVQVTVGMRIRNWASGSEPTHLNSMAPCLFIYIFMSYVLLAPGCPRATRKRKAGSITSGLRRDRGVQLGKELHLSTRPCLRARELCSCLLQPGLFSNEASETAIGLVVLPTQARP